MFGEACVGLDRYPNATISDYGAITVDNAINRGPIACGTDASNNFGLHFGHRIRVLFTHRSHCQTSRREGPR